MSATFASQLRVNGADTIRLAPDGAAALRVRVQFAEAWDLVRVDASANTPVSVVKQAAFGAMLPGEQYPEDYVVKLRGWEILDEEQSLGQAGVVDGSTLLVHFRRRRPVR